MNARYSVYRLMSVYTLSNNGDSLNVSEMGKGFCSLINRKNSWRIEETVSPQC